MYIYLQLFMRSNASIVHLPYVNRWRIMQIISCAALHWWILCSDCFTIESIGTRQICLFLFLSLFLLSFVLVILCECLCFFCIICLVICEGLQLLLVLCVALPK